MTDQNDAFVQRTRAERDRISTVAPGFVAAFRDYLFPKVWDDPTPSKRERTIVTLSILITLHRPERLSIHIANAMECGLTRKEIGASITHATCYAKFQSAAAAAETSHRVFEQMRAP